MLAKLKLTLRDHRRGDILVMTCACGAVREESIGMMVEVGRFGSATPDQAAAEMQCPKGHVGEMTAEVKAPPSGFPRSFMGRPVYYAGKIS